MRHGPICKRQPKPPFNFPSGDEKYHSVLAPVSRSYPNLTGRLPTCYSPVRRSFHKFHPEGINLLPDRKSTRLNSSHVSISYAVFCLKKKKKESTHTDSS